MSEATARMRSASDLLLELQDEHDFPLSAMVELTRRCNLRCRHCFLDLDDHPGLPTERLLRMWDELAGAGVLFLTLTGGEIAVRPDWLALAEAARSRGFALRLKTNALALTREDIERVARLAVFAVDVSLYGPTADVHDSVTGLPGSFDRSMSAVEEFRKAGVSVTLRGPLMSSNAQLVGETVKLARELECGASFDPGLLGTILGDDDKSCLRAPTAEITMAVRALVERGLLPRPTSAQPDQRSCLDRQRDLYVRADGQVWLCPSLPVAFGDATERSVVEVWRESPVRRALAERSRRIPPECVECRYRGFCHRCFGRSYLEHRTIDRAATADCQLAACFHAMSLEAEGRGCDTAACVSEDRSSKGNRQAADGPPGHPHGWEGRR